MKNTNESRYLYISVFLGGRGWITKGLYFIQYIYVYMFFFYLLLLW